VIGLQLRYRSLRVGATAPAVAKPRQRVPDGQAAIASGAASVQALALFYIFSFYIADRMRRNSHSSLSWQAMTRSSAKVATS
jgi:hypothetical protein